MSEVALQASRHDDINKNKLWYYLLWAAKPQLWHDNDLSRKVIIYEHVPDYEAESRKKNRPRVLLKRFPVPSVMNYIIVT
jgi:hypothetical protein